MHNVEFSVIGTTAYKLSFMEEMREKFRRLKQGGSSVYKYNVEFHELARYAKQDIPDQKSKIYQFKGGVKEDLQLALALHDPHEFDKFYNLALKAEAALLKVENLRKHFRDSSSSSSTQVVHKQQQYWVSPPPRQIQQFKQSGGRGSSHPPNLASSRGFNNRSKGILKCNFVRCQRSLFTSVGRRVTTPTSAPLSSVFLPLLK